MAPTEGPQITIIFFSGVGVIDTMSITGPMSISRAAPITRAAIIIHTAAIPNTATIPRTVAITSTMTIRLPAIDKDHIAGFQLILLSFINQFTFPILDQKAKVRLKFLTLAGVRFDRC